MTTAHPQIVERGGDRLPGGFDPRRLRQEFPIFANNPDLVFLDSGRARKSRPRSSTASPIITAPTTPTCIAESIG